MTASALPAGAAPATPLPALSALAGQASNVPLTRVSLAYIEARFKLYLRFGEPARTLRLDRWRRCAVFLPRAMFCRVRWEANDYGTIRWQLMVMQAATPLDDMQRIPGVRPHACCCTPKAKRGACRAGTHRRHRRARHRRHRRVVRVLAHAGQLSGGPPGAARIHRRAARRLAGRKGAAMTTQSNTTCTQEAAPHPRSRRCARLALAGFAAVGLAALAWAAFVSPLPRLTYNPSNSVAVGWYRIEPFDPRTASLPRPLSVDSIVLVPLPDRAAMLAAARLPADARAAAQTWARLRRNTSASSPGRYASTACLRPPCCLPTGWAGRCHPCSFAAALSRANCSC